MVKTSNTQVWYTGIFPNLQDNRFANLINYVSSTAFVQKYPNLVVFDIPGDKMKAIVIKQALKVEDGTMSISGMRKIDNAQKSDTSLPALLEEFGLQNVLKTQIFTYKMLEGGDQFLFDYVE